MSKLNLIQALRRLGQQQTGWSDSFKTQDAQMPLIKKLYAKHELELKMTCGACPELYEVFKDGKQVAYLRLRWGEFRVDYPDCGGETIFWEQPKGDGIFDPDERLLYMSKALKEILKKMPNEPKPEQ